MEHEKTEGVYIFQSNCIVVPPDTPDSRLHAEVDSDLFNAALGAFADKDSFTIPPIDGKNQISVVMLGEGELPPGWKAYPLRHSLSIITGGNMAEGAGPLGRILRAYHFCLWRKESLFCGKCGGANRDQPGEISRICTVCGREEFPRISPAVITIIINEKDQALLAHNRKFIPGMYSLIAGFNEAGESLEATVAREIKEEVNLEVKDIRYVKSQPWPFPNSLMVGFCARYLSGELKPDGIEIEDAQWFSKDALPRIPYFGSVSRYLIDEWLEGKL